MLVTTFSFSNFYQQRAHTHWSHSSLIVDMSEIIILKEREFRKYPKLLPHAHMFRGHERIEGAQWRWPNICERPKTRLKPTRSWGVKGLDLGHTKAMPYEDTWSDITATSLQAVQRHATSCVRGQNQRPLHQGSYGRMSCPQGDHRLYREENPSPRYVFSLTFKP